jgi:hypothetical protein
VYSVSEIHLLVIALQHAPSTALKGRARDYVIATAFKIAYATCG